MSARLLSAALGAPAPFGSAVAKLILIKLVDCCDDEGRNIWPSKATLARAGCCSERHVTEVMRRLCDIGLLRRLTEGGKGPGSTARYEMDIGLLRRATDDGWPDAGDGTLGDGVQPAREPEAGEGAECANIRVNPVHPYDEGGDPSRVNCGADKGEARVHPTPQEEPLNLRESAGGGADAGLPAGGGARHDGVVAQVAAAGGGDGGQGAGQPAGQPAGPTLEDFLKGWPTAAADSLERTASAWAALDFGERREAVASIGRFCAHLKALKRDRTPAGFTYLAEKRWLRIGPETAEHAAATHLVVLKPLTKDWWAVIIDRADKGLPLAARLAMAAEGKGFQCTLGEFPASLRDRLKACPAGAEHARGWWAWFRAKGHRLPDMRPDAWVFLPEGGPPGVGVAGDAGLGPEPEVRL